MNNLDAPTIKSKRHNLFQAVGWRMKNIIQWAKIIKDVYVFLKIPKKYHTCLFQNYLPRKDTLPG